MVWCEELLPTLEVACSMFHPSWVYEKIVSKKQINYYTYLVIIRKEASEGWTQLSASDFTNVYYLCWG